MGIATVEREEGTFKQHFEGGLQSEEFCFHAEESAQLPGEEVCFERPTEAPSNLLCW
jgi:hypothetical protein